MKIYFSNISGSLHSKYLPVQVSNRNTREGPEICSKLITKTPGQCRRRSGVFIVKFKHNI